MGDEVLPCAAVRGPGRVLIGRWRQSDAGMKRKPSADRCKIVVPCVGAAQVETTREFADAVLEVDFTIEGQPFIERFKEIIQRP